MLPGFKFSDEGILGRVCEALADGALSVRNDVVLPPPIEKLGGLDEEELEEESGEAGDEEFDDDASPNPESIEMLEADDGLKRSPSPGAATVASRFSEDATDALVDREGS